MPLVEVLWDELVLLAVFEPDEVAVAEVDDVSVPVADVDVLPEVLLDCVTTL